MDLLAAYLHAHNSDINIKKNKLHGKNNIYMFPLAFKILVTMQLLLGQL